MLHPLNDLLKSRTPWNWTEDCCKTMQLAKDALTSIISHILPNGDERPVAFASRTLTSAEKNYPQIEKEALGLVFGVRKFHQYLYGTKFTLVTDHKPLMAILGPKKGIPSLAAARLQRWAILLSTYTDDIKFRPTDVHANADGLSCLPLPTSEPLEPHSEINSFNILRMETLPATAAKIQQETRKDPLLSKVHT